MERSTSGEPCWETTRDMLACSTLRVQGAAEGQRAHLGSSSSKHISQKERSCRQLLRQCTDVMVVKTMDDVRGSPVGAGP